MNDSETIRAIDRASACEDGYCLAVIRSAEGRVLAAIKFDELGRMTEARPFAWLFEPGAEPTILTDAVYRTAFDL